MLSKCLIAILFLSISMTFVHCAYKPFEPDLIKLTNNALADINLTPQQQFNSINTTPLVNTDTDSDVFMSITSNGVLCARGTYMVDIVLYHTSVVEDTNTSIEVTVAGVATGIRGANGYIRNTAGHNESTTTVSDLVRLASPSKIGFSVFQLARAGVVVLPAAQSSINIVRIDDK